ncbi:hypothetical protein P5G51_001975 [Virgibacillus sp. 179-BFC.A HS]|uniref:Uncharacterized protein n=1 Tax=Tigheibacillus jepli TaxID=3035914 RepID=A0ABU5CDC6_9BACI|nr:hypothetical protein [Virgibacillus sp. 179-BFC.A HS]MDY0404344.1 hypothetical protein [Virgibacillus sp. 179-BFC.A HS]
MKHFLMMVYVAGFAALHYASTLVVFGKYLYLAILLVATVIAWKVSFASRKMIG